MKILNIKIFRGPNIWSNYRKNIIAVSLDLQNWAEIFSNQIAGFNDALQKLIPSLYSHHCSEGKEGGFITRLKEGTLLGHVIEHVALELQTLAGMTCGYGKTRESKTPGVFNIIFSYVIEEAGLYAIHTAIDIIEHLINGKSYQILEDNIRELRSVFAEKRLGTSTEAILAEAYKRHIPFTLLNDEIIMLGYGCNQRIISAAVTSRTSSLGVDMVADKKLTKDVLSSAYISVPEGSTIKKIEELLTTIKSLGFPLVIKPRFGNHGKGVTTNIGSVEAAITAFQHAKKISDSVIVEKFIAGSDYRFLVINFKFVAAAKRVRANIIGDGKKTIQQLIDEINANPLRGKAHDNFLTTIALDHKTFIILEENGLTLDSVLPEKELLYLKDTANLSAGATAEDVTEIIPEETITLVERIARLTNLDVCGIDIIANDITKKLTATNGAVLEVNASPGLRMHLAPSIGKKRNVAKPFVDMLYPNGQSSRIPITAVTGTNGKTTVVRLLAHIATQANFSVGMTTTEGVYINQKLVHEGDCSGPASAQVVLRDPLINFAVLECARGGILRAGLAFDNCNVSVLTNISEDHLGMGDVHSKEDLLDVKSVVSHSTLDNGYAVLNADDDLVYNLKNDLACQIALFSHVKSDRIMQHANNGGLCCYIDNNVICIIANRTEHKIMDISKVPLSFEGKSKCMKENILAATLAAWANDIKIDNIIQGLSSFFPTSLHLPGRMNMFHFDNCKVMLDYAHNENAYVSMKNYLDGIKASKKIGIIAGTGDRRDIDIWRTGFYAALMFDSIIIRQDEDSRGRTKKEIADLLLAGIRHVDVTKTVHCINDEFEAIQYAINTAVPDTFIWYFPDKVLSAIEFLQRYNHENFINKHKSMTHVS